jgi:hypothetical protein
MPKRKQRKSKVVRKPLSKRKPDRPHAARDNRTPHERHLAKLTQQTTLSMYAEGKTPEQIASVLGMRVVNVKQAIKAAINDLIKHYTDPTPEHTFVRYAAFQFGVIAKLQDACELFMNDERNKQYNALTSALRAQSDIYDKIVDKGLTFGVIERKRATGDHRMSKGDLRTALRDEMSVLSRLLDQVDDATQMASVRVTQTQTTITYAPKLRKPLRDSRGIVRAVPDWKYRSRLWDRDGKYIPIDQHPDNADELLIPRDEYLELQRQLYKSRSQPYIEHRDGTISPAPQPTDETIDTEATTAQSIKTQSKEQPTYLVKPRIARQQEP